MKNITTILLIILALGCNAQEPQTIIKHLDSLNAVIAERDSVMLDQDRVIDSLIDASKVLNPLMIADTFNYTIMGLTDSLKVSIEKTGEHIKIGLKNGEKIIFYVDF